MKQPPIPANEPERIGALRNANILDTPIQESFERITRLAKIVFQVPIVAFSLVDSERQWFKSIQGLDVCETSREVSFCGHTINQDDIFIVNDALLDERFSDNPLVMGAPNIRFYAGCPVRGINKEKIGSLCIIDQKPRSFSTAELVALKDMAALIETEVAANKINFDKLKLTQDLCNIKKTALVDGLTRVLNRASIENLLQHKIQQANATNLGFGVALIDVDDFKKINDTHGHCAGDEVLRQLAKRLLIGYRDFDTIGRWGGEEFLVILDLQYEKDLLKVAERARSIIADKPIIFENKSLTITITTGVSWYNGHTSVLTDLITDADKALYSGKHKGKNIVVAGTSISQRKVKKVGADS
jgi:diguanylate cyclase (GGDEF)-like protein